MKIVIMAGGKGTRISSLYSDIPKPMIDLNNKPVLEHQIDFFKSYGYRDFIIVTGHLGHIIHEYFKDGSFLGINIEYYHEQYPLGTAGALKKIKPQLNDDFILVNGDIIFDFDLERFINFHKSKQAVASILTHPNSHPYDSSLIFTNDNNEVINWIVKEDNREGVYGNRVNAGLHLFSNNIYKFIDKIDKEKIDLDRDIFKQLLISNGLYAYDTPEYIHDMGTPERYQQVLVDLQNNIPAKKNLKNKQKAVFLDRDGTINKHKGFINNNKDIELLTGVSAAIKKINSSEYLAIVITNQPVIARGECSFEELEKIHNKLKYLLGLDGAFVDDIFYCPHHPDSGFDGEVKELKKICECRKPNNGLILEAAKKYNIDLDNSYMVGDSLSDVQAGEKSNCISYLISNELDNDFNVVESLAEFVEILFDRKGEL